MSNREWENMSDTDFEAMLESSVSEVLPEDIVAKVTPWKKSINRVLSGMALTAITLDFWCLNYVLPAIGTILLLLGFRALWRENKWFGRCFVVSIIRAAFIFSSLILYTTIVRGIVYTSAITHVRTTVGFFCYLLSLFIFGMVLYLFNRKQVFRPMQAWRPH